jgi:hypothetical protein
MTLTDADATALFARLDQLDDPRGARGRRHAQRSLALAPARPLNGRPAITALMATS